MTDPAKKRRKPNLTALASAGHKAIESEKPEGERICYDPYADRFVGREGRELAEKIKQSLPETGLLVPLRTRYIDDHLKAKARQGLKQVVLLGAGYDSRALRMEELRGVRVFEVDHPDTSEDKVEKVREILGALPPQVAYIPMDFLVETLEDLKRKLTQKGYSLALKTLFILESVVMFLTPEAVDNLLTLITTFSGPGSSVIFNYLSLEKSGGFRDVAEREVKSWGEESRMSFGIDPQDVGRFLEERGFCHIENRSLDEIRRIYTRIDLPLPSTYSIVSAEVGGEVPNHQGGNNADRV